MRPKHKLRALPKYLALFVLTAACCKKGEWKEISEYDGCKLFRVCTPCGGGIYVTKCKNGSAKTTVDRLSGKTRVREETETVAE